MGFLGVRAACCRFSGASLLARTLTRTRLRGLAAAADCTQSGREKTKTKGRLRVFPGLAWVAVLLVAVSGSCPAQFEDQEAPPRFAVRITMEMIEVSTATCDALIAEPKTSVDDSALRKELRTLTDKGEAVLLDIASVTTLPGLPARSESIREDICPTEYDPYEIANMPSKQTKDAPPVDPASLRTPFTVAGLETKNVGATMEIEPATRDDGKSYQVTFSLEWVGRHADAIFAKWKDAVVETELRMPTFHTLRLKGHAMINAGLPTRVGILSPKGPDGLPDPGRKVFVFLRAETLQPSRSSPKSLPR